MHFIVRQMRHAAFTAWLSCAVGGCGDSDSAARDAGPDARAADSATRDAGADAAAGSDGGLDAAADSGGGAMMDAAASDGGSSDATAADGGTGSDAAVEAGTNEDAAVEAGANDDAAIEAGTNEDAAVEGGTNDAAIDGGVDPEPSEDTFSMRVVTSGLDAPWEVTWGPDDYLWITERTGLRVTRVDPVTGDSTVALAVADAHQSAGQDGVLGMALDPRLGLEVGGDYVYLAYTYDIDAGGDVDRRARIVRYTYSIASESLGSPLVLLEGLPASNDHNSGRLVYGPDDHLYYTIGDQGNNQFDNRCRVIRAQDLPSQADVDGEDWSDYQGKVLRLALDGSVPADNPVIAGVRSHIYSYGHRNAQGIGFGADGKLYVSEQGPKTDDEINWIQPGRNYGWPHVAGYRDDRAYVYGNWSASTPESCASLPFSDYFLPPSVPQQAESAWTQPDFSEPLVTLYTVDDDYQFMNTACFPNDYICWPTIAPSSLQPYVPGTNGFTTWGNALLVPSLKEGCVFRMRLNPTGTAAMLDGVELFKTTNRYRDLTIAPDNRTFYIVTDNDGSTSGPTSGSTQVLENRGAVLEFTHEQ